MQVSEGPRCTKMCLYHDNKRNDTKLKKEDNLAPPLAKIWPNYHQLDETTKSTARLNSSSAEEGTWVLNYIVKQQKTFSNIKMINFLTRKGHGMSIPKRSSRTSLKSIEYIAFLSPWEAKYSSDSLARRYPLKTLMAGSPTWKIRKK